MPWISDSVCVQFRHWFILFSFFPFSLPVFILIIHLFSNLSFVSKLQCLVFSAMHFVLSILFSFLSFSLTLFLLIFLKNRPHHPTVPKLRRKYTWHKKPRTTIFSSSPFFLSHSFTLAKSRFLYISKNLWVSGALDAIVSLLGSWRREFIDAFTRK